MINNIWHCDCSTPDQTASHRSRVSQQRPAVAGYPFLAIGWGTRMANKHVLFRSAAREKIMHGATALADAVRITLGPRSKCVLIEK